jgi:GH24 family phage-related lysozyme (muramidase)
MQTAINLIKEFVQPVTKATYCPLQDTYYIGYNQTLGVYNGLSWSQEEADKDLQQQVNNITKVLQSSFMGMLSKHQQVALISLIHDIGTEVFLRSDIPKYIRSSNYILVSNAFLRYNLINRTVSITKVRRRLKEQAIFNTTVEKYQNDNIS